MSEPAPLYVTGEFSAEICRTVAQRIAHFFPRILVKLEAWVENLNELKGDSARFHRLFAAGLTARG